VDNAVKSFNDSSNGQNYQDDVEPWLGDSAGVALTSVDIGGGSPNWVAFVASKDDAKAKDAINGGDTHADGEYNGYSQYVSTRTTPRSGSATGP